MKKTIVEINSMNFGSTGNIMAGIALTARGQGMEVFTYSPAGRSQKKYVEGHHFIGCIPERRVSDFINTGIGYQGSLNWFGTKKFLKELDKIKPDIIHLHNLHSNYINLSLVFQYIKSHDIKVIWTLHDCWAFTGHCPHFAYAGCNKWKSGCKNCVMFREYPASYMDRSSEMYKRKKKLFTGISDMTIVAPSQWLASLIKQSYLKEYPVRMIYNGIDLDVFKPTKNDFREKNGLLNKKIVLGVAMSWGQRKGLDVFQELAKQLDDSYQIVLVGTNEKLDRCLPDNIISIHKTRDKHELAEIYTAADVFVNPTREEVFGLVNVEALACGTPVVTFATGGCPEIVDQTCGSIVPQDDINQMIWEIKRVVEKSPYTKSDCINRAKLYDEKQLFLAYMELYEKK